MQQPMFNVATRHGTDRVSIRTLLLRGVGR